MKTALALAVLLSMAPLSASATDAEFDPNEKITLDLKDASIADLVTTLGALANMPVSIDPGVSGMISIQLDKVPFDKVLKLVSAQTGVSVRIENGKLVASRSIESSLPAAALPDQYRKTQRLPVAEVSRVTPTKPLFVRTKWNGGSACHRLDFNDGDRPTISFPIAQDEASPRLSVTQFSFDPVSGLRYLALDGVGLSGAVAVGGISGMARTLENKSVSLFVFVAEKADPGCADASLREEPPSQQAQLRFQVRAIDPEGSGEVVMAPSISLLAGTTFKLQSRGARDERTGQQREIVLSGYLSRDATWAVVHLMPTAIWLDPADGVEYFYTQSGTDSLTPILTSEGAVEAAIPAGAATPRPLELTMFKAVSGKAAPAPRVN